MKLTNLAKNILSELNIHSGTLGNPPSLQLLIENVDLVKEFSFLNKYIKDVLNVRLYYGIEGADLEKLNVPIPKDLKQLIASKSHSSQGNLHVFKSKSPGWGGPVVVYYLLNLDASSITTLFVAQIETARPIDREYSLKRLYGVNTIQVHMSQVAKEYNALGYAKFLYDTILYENQILESDNTLFQGSFNMWTKHFPKVASYFGFIPTRQASNKRGSSNVAGNDNIVLPMESLNLTDKSFLKNYVASFVAFSGPVPVELKKIKQLTKDVSFANGTLGIHFFLFDDEGLNSKIDHLGPDRYDDETYSSFPDYLESFTFDEFLNSFDRQLTYTKSSSAVKKIIVMLRDAQLVLSEDSDGSIKYDLI